VVTVSVVIPAHNEERAIGACLTRLLSECVPGELDVVVVCNGCRDRTEEVARSFGAPVRVESLAAASKAGALRRGDKVAEGFPRAYLDADVDLTLRDLRAVAAALDEGHALVASASLEMDTSASSLLVRSYYRFHTRLPTVAEDVVGRGLYVLSEEGRSRFDEFPDLLGDDHYVRSQFRDSERMVVSAARSTVRAPGTLGALVGRKIRVAAGNRQVDRLGGPSSDRRRRGARGVMSVLAAEPRRLIDLPAYALVAVVVRVRLLGRRRVAWGTDDSRSEHPGAERGSRMTWSRG
jgi:glycosyltransferase involved in cell wall biosynthesis